MDWVVKVGGKSIFVGCWVGKSIFVRIFCEDFFCEDFFVRNFL